MNRLIALEVYRCVAVPCGVDGEAAGGLFVPEVVGAVVRPRGVLVESLIRLLVGIFVAGDEEQRNSREREYEMLMFQCIDSISFKYCCTTSLPKITTLVFALDIITFRRL